MADIKKFVGQEAVEEIVAQVKSGDAATRQSAKDYADSLGVNYEVAGAAATALADSKTYTNDKIATVNETVATKADQTALQSEIDRAIAKENEIVASVEAVDAKADKNAEDIAAINDETSGILAQAKAEDAKVQAEVDALEEFVGEIPEGYTAKTVAEYAKELADNVAANGYDDTAIQARIAAVEGEVDAIQEDYLTSENEDALKELISTAQKAADDAQAHSEGVADDLATETSERKAADESQVGRIVTLEEQILGLSGAMHFQGVKNALPEGDDLASYVDGDVIIVGNKEYVMNNGAFVEFGDVSAQAEAITALTGRMDTAEGEIDVLQGEMDAVEAAVAAKAEQSALNEAVEALEDADEALDTRVKALEGAVGESGSVAEDIASAKQEAIDAAAADATTKANAAETNAKAYADTLNTAMDARVDALEADTHTHANKDELDLIASGDKAKWDAASAKAHEHDNKDVLAGITAEKVSNWDAAEQNAKDYADGLVDTVEGTVEALDERVAANEAAITLKAAQADLTALAERVTTNETNIAANTSAINSIVAYTANEIKAMFA